MDLRDYRAAAGWQATAISPPRLHLPKPGIAEFMKAATYRLRRRQISATRLILQNSSMPPLTPPPLPQ